MERLKKGAEVEAVLEYDMPPRIDRDPLYDAELIINLYKIDGIELKQTNMSPRPSGRIFN